MATANRRKLTAIPGQNGRPGTPQATQKLIRRLYAVHGPTQTCGHDNPTITVRTDTGEVLSCRRCVLTAVDDRPGIWRVEPLPSPGGDDAA